mgnify:CR=1 FL=1
MSHFNSFHCDRTVRSFQLHNLDFISFRHNILIFFLTWSCYRCLKRKLCTFLLQRRNQNHKILQFRINRLRMKLFFVENLKRSQTSLYIQHTSSVITLFYLSLLYKEVRDCKKIILQFLTIRITNNHSPN